MLESSNCCCGVFGIAIWNGNSITDDNFNIFLNGNLIGSINNNFMAYTGRIFTPSEADFVPTKFGPRHPNSFQPSVHLDTALLINGVNTLRIVDTQVNGAGNEGLVRIGKWKLDEVAVGFYDIHPPTLLDTTYSGLAGPGLGVLGGFQEYNFTYP